MFVVFSGHRDTEKFFFVFVATIQAKQVMRIWNRNKKTLETKAPKFFTRPTSSPPTKKPIPTKSLGFDFLCPFLPRAFGGKTQRGGRRISGVKKKAFCVSVCLSDLRSGPGIIFLPHTLLSLISEQKVASGRRRDTKFENYTARNVNLECTGKRRRCNGAK